jgi:hypothetical protein
MATICLSWVPTASSRRSSRVARASLEARICRNRTKARTTKTLVWTAWGELSTLAAMMAPCSVKAYGSFRRPPRPTFDVADCDIKPSNSSRLSRNAKSGGNRSILRLTCSLSLPVLTPYNWARSESKMKPAKSGSRCASPEQLGLSRGAVVCRPDCRARRPVLHLSPSSFPHNRTICIRSANRIYDRNPGSKRKGEINGSDTSIAVWHLLLRSQSATSKHHQPWIHALLRALRGGESLQSCRIWLKMGQKALKSGRFGLDWGFVFHHGGTENPERPLAGTKNISRQDAKGAKNGGRMTEGRGRRLPQPLPIYASLREV